MVFCDIDLNTFNIDVDQIEKRFPQKQKVILPVHLFGMPADMKKLKVIAQKYNLKVIEDLRGFGSKINNQHVGLIWGCWMF